MRFRPGRVQSEWMNETWKLRYLKMNYSCIQVLIPFILISARQGFQFLPSLFWHEPELVPCWQPRAGVSDSVSDRKLTQKKFQFFTDESSEINIPKSLVHVEPFWHNFLCHSIVCGRRPLTLFQIQKDFKFIQEFPSSDLPAFTPRVWQVYHVFLSCLCVCVFVVELSCNTWACMLVKFEILYIMLKSNQKQWKIMKTQHVGGMFRLCTTHKC